MVSHDLAFEHFPRHLPILTSKYYRHFSKKFHKKSHHIIAVSEWTKKDIVEQYQIDDKKITVAHNAAPAGFSPLNQDEKQKVRDQYAGSCSYFIYLGAIHPRKNIRRLIQAFDLFSKGSTKEFRLILIGRFAWNCKSIKKQIRESPFRSRIHIYSNLEDEVTQILAAAECLIYISLLEGFGIPILEAMNCQVPVITSEKSAMEEVANDAALYVNPLDVQEVCSAMTKIVSQKDLAQMLVERGKKRAGHFSWDTTSETVYQKIIQS